VHSLHTPVNEHVVSGWTLRCLSPGSEHRVGAGGSCHGNCGRHLCGTCHCKRGTEALVCRTVLCAGQCCFGAPYCATIALPSLPAWGMGCAQCSRLVGCQAGLCVSYCCVLCFSDPHQEAPEDPGCQQAQQWQWGGSAGQEPGRQSGLEGGPQRVPGHSVHDEVRQPGPNRHRREPPPIMPDWNAVKHVPEASCLRAPKGVAWPLIRDGPRGSPVLPLACWLPTYSVPWLSTPCL